MAFPFGVVPPCDCLGLDDFGDPSHDMSAVHFDTFNCYALSFELAARELASRPEAQDNPSLQDEICRKYGLFLDNMTDDEISELEHQIQMI